MSPKTRLYVISSVSTSGGPRAPAVERRDDDDDDNKSPLSPVTGAVNNPVCDPGDAFEDAAYA